MWNLLKHKRETFRVDVAGLDRDLAVNGDETLLSALLRQQVEVNHLCLVGECGSCRCKLTSGRVRLKRDVSARLSEDDLRRGHILACQSIALGDVEIGVPGVGAGLGDFENAPGIAAAIEGVRRLAHNVIELTVRPEIPVSFEAGQFATIRCEAVPDLADGTRCYSFAEPRSDTDLLHFHVRHVPGGRFTDWLFEADRTGVPITITGVAGTFGYRATGRPILCIAGGTGLAPIRSILRSLAGTGAQPDVTLMLAARTYEDLYGVLDIEQLAGAWPGSFSLLPILSDEPADTAWDGRRGFCTDHFEGLGPLAGHDVYVCGPPAMIDAVTDRLRGLVPEGQLHVDRFLDQSSTH